MRECKDRAECHDPPKLISKTCKTLWLCIGRPAFLVKVVGFVSKPESCRKLAVVVMPLCTSAVCEVLETLRCSWSSFKRTHES